MAKFRLRAREEEKLELPQELGEAGQGCQLPKFSTTEEQCQIKELAGSDAIRLRWGEADQIPGIQEG